MNNKQSNELYEKIEKLERKRMEYLEVNKKSDARRIKKQIEKIQQEIELSKYDKLRQKLEIYKSIVKDYPSIQNRIRCKLLELKVKD